MERIKDTGIRLMNEIEKDIWKTRLGNTSILETPLVIAAIECREGYPITLYTHSTIEIDKSFQTLREAQQYANAQIKILVYQSLQIIEPPPQNFL